MNTIRELEEINRRIIPLWQESFWLKGSLCNHRTNTSRQKLCGYLLTYDRYDGLIIIKEDYMSEREFCLLYHPWILAMRQDGKTEELSLLEALSRAHELKDLSGEVPAQDAALLRFSAFNSTLGFARYSPEGSFSEIRDTNDAFKRWSELWERGVRCQWISLPDISINMKTAFTSPHLKNLFFEYRIWEEVLITSAKLNGEISESGNKIRLFPQRTGKQKQQLSYAEAARWRIFFINAFDDSSVSPATRGLKASGKTESPEQGWLGKLGLIMAKVLICFETLLLNLVLLPDTGDSLWEKERPSWEFERRAVKKGCVSHAAKPFGALHTAIPKDNA